MSSLPVEKPSQKEKFKDDWRKLTLQEPRKQQATIENIDIIERPGSTHKGMPEPAAL